MASQAYRAGVGRIKEQLSCYSHRSVLSRVLARLSMKFSDPEHEHAMMPWVVMFLLKMSMLGPNGKAEISLRDFNRIANDVFHLQSAAVGFDSGSFELKLRAMVLGQDFYQKSTRSGFRELFLQRKMFTRLDNYYEELFREAFGLGLDSYLKIAMFVVVRLDKQVQSEVVKMPISELLLFLCPAIPYTEILAFIRLSSCDVNDLSGFVEGHDLGDAPESEYFQETPFKYIPFILDGSGLVAFNYKFCITALCGLAPALLKKERPNFKDQFGADMEYKVGGLLNLIDYDELVAESELQYLLKVGGIKSKVVDYLVREGDEITLIECKAIEPTDLMKCTADPEILRRGLEKNYIKAIHQGQAVASALAKLVEFEKCSFRLLVITYGDHYVFGGEYIAQNIDMNLVDKISASYGGLPIPMSRISYLAFQDFSGLIHGLKQKGRLLSSVLDASCDAQSLPAKRRMTLAHSLEAEIGAVPGSFAAGLGDEMDKASDALQALLKENTQYWSGKVELFVERQVALMNALNPSYLDAKIG